MPRYSLFAALSFVSAACIVAAPPAEAVTVGLHLASVHLPKRDFNNTNPGLYVRTDGGWTAGAYRNSLNRTSAYAGYTMEWGRLAGFSRSSSPCFTAPRSTLWKPISSATMISAAKADGHHGARNAAGSASHHARSRCDAVFRAVAEVRRMAQRRLRAGGDACGASGHHGVCSAGSAAS